MDFIVLRQKVNQMQLCCTTLLFSFPRVFCQKLTLQQMFRFCLWRLWSDYSQRIWCSTGTLPCLFCECEPRCHPRSDWRLPSVSPSVWCVCVVLCCVVWMCTPVSDFWQIAMIQHESTALWLASDVRSVDIQCSVGQSYLLSFWPGEGWEGERRGVNEWIPPYISHLTHLTQCHLLKDRKVVCSICNHCHQVDI